MNVSVLSNTKEDILKKVCKQALLGTVDSHSRKKILWNGAHNCSVSHILQNILLCVQQNKDMMVSK